MPIFLDIYHYLQATSDRYPLIDANILNTEFLSKVEHMSKESFY